MAFNAGEIVAHIKADTSDFQKGIAETKKATGGLTSSLSSLHGGLSAVGAKFISLQGAIAGVGLTALIANVAKAGADYKRLEETLEVVRKNTGMTTEEILKMKDALRDANLQGQDATKTLLTFVQSGLGAMTDMEQFTLMAKDYAASIGVSSKEGVQDFTQAIGTLSPQLLAKYRLIVNLNQVYGEYAEKMGIAVKDMTAQEKKMALLNTIYKEHENTVKGVYKETYDTAGKAMSSVKDAISALKDEMGLALEPAMKEIALALRDFLQDGIKWFQNNKEAVNEFGQKLAEVTKTLLAFIAKVGKFAVEHPKLVALIGALVAGFIALSIAVYVLTPVVTGLIAVFSFLGTMLSGLVTIVPVIVGAIGAISAPVLIVIGIIAGLIAVGVLLWQNWDLIVQKAQEFGSYLLSLAQQIGQFFAELYEAHIRPVFEKIMTILTQIGEFFTWWWDNLIYPVLYLIFSVFAWIFNEIFQIVKTHFENIFGTWLTIFTAIWEFMIPWLEQLKAIIQVTWAFIQSATQSAWEFIKQKIITPTTQARDQVIAIINALKAFIEGIWNGIHSFLLSIGGRIKDAIVKPFQDAKNRIEEIGRQIKEAANRINPFHRESPSLVDNVRAGLDIIKDEYAKLATDLNIPSVAGIGAGVGSMAGGGQSINVNIQGMAISDGVDVNSMAERIGYEITRRT